MNQGFGKSDPQHKQKPQNKKSEYLSALSEALILQKQGNNKQAITLYIKALQCDEDKHDWKALLNLGIIYRDLKDLEMEISSLKKANSLNPQYDQIIERLSVAYLESQEYVEAKALAEANISKYPNSAILNTVIGICSTTEGQYARAKTHLKHALNCQPNMLAATESLGLLYTKTKHYSQAVDLFDELIQLKPLNSKGYSLKSNALALQGKLNDALASIRTAITIDPDNHLYQAELTRLKFLIDGGNSINSNTDNVQFYE